jgi:hypothetical protein
MIRLFRVALLVTYAVALLPAIGSAERQNASGTDKAGTYKCELTKANGRYPQSQAPGKASDFYGNESIAIALGSDGSTIVFEPGGAGFVLPDGALQYKFLWAKARLPMTIEGRRLDAPAPPLRSHVSDSQAYENFQPSSLIFPTPGCWAITSRVGASALTFVVKVVKIGNGPDPLSSWVRVQERIRAQANVNLVDSLDLPSAPW